MICIICNICTLYAKALGVCNTPHYSQEKKKTISAQVPSTSPRTHVTSHVAPPTYFCKPPCVWKYGGTSDSTAARPKFIAPVFT